MFNFYCYKDENLKQGFSQIVHIVTNKSKQYINTVLFYRHFKLKFERNYILKQRITIFVLFCCNLKILFVGTLNF